MWNCHIVCESGKGSLHQKGAHSRKCDSLFKAHPIDPLILTFYLPPLGCSNEARTQYLALLGMGDIYPGCSALA